MSENVSIVLVGIGGYGNTYVEALLDAEEINFEIVGAVDPRPEGCRRLAELKELNIPFFDSLVDFYRENTAELAVISSPIQFHCEQTIIALQNGSNVLCEKPIAATVQEAQQMMAVRDQVKKFVAIGFQWSHNEAILELKQDIMQGALGNPVRLKTLVLWPRDSIYYGRSVGWAGKQKDLQGKWVLDSVANNATAHYLHNMFFVLGEQINKSAKPSWITAELYRANNIENFDTAAIRLMTNKDVEILYYATHATVERKDPVFEYEFSKAVVTYDQGKENNIIAKWHDGRKKEYGNPHADYHRKLWLVIDKVRDDSVILPCELETAYSHLLSINGSQESMPKITEFSSEMINQIELENSTLLSVETLADTFKTCYAEDLLPSEKGYHWAKLGKKIDLENYTYFKGVN